MKDRRSFLKKIGLTGLAAGVLPVSKLAGAENTPDLPPCDATTVDYYGQGPFYTPNAPQISQNMLATASEPGQRLIISGTVYAQDCITTVPNALLDIWHANDAGQYDNTGYNLRGQLHADANGNYQYETILPGKYLNGSSYRPRHIHLKVSAPDFDDLTTQLYFQGDTDIPGDAAASITSGTYNASDRIIPIMQNSTTGKWEGTFDMILNNPALAIQEHSLHIHFGLITACSPNPVRGQARIGYSVFKHADVSLDVYDMDGQLVTQIQHGEQAPGKYELTWAPENSGLSKGFYLLSLQVNGLHVHHMKIQLL